MSYVARGVFRRVPPVNQQQGSAATAVAAMPSILLNGYGGLEILIAFRV